MLGELEMLKKKIVTNCRACAVMVTGLCRMDWLIEGRVLLAALQQSCTLKLPWFIYNLVIDGLCMAGIEGDRRTAMHFG